MTKNQGYAALTTLCMLATATAHAEIFRVNFINEDPTYSALFGGLSFVIDTAKTTVNSFSVGPCGDGTTPGVYESAQFDGGVLAGGLLWNGVTYNLQNATMYFEEDDGSCGFYLNISLSFAGGVSFSTQDQTAGGPYPYSDYTLTTLLNTTLPAGYNDRYMANVRLVVPGYPGTPDNFLAIATPLP